jgi:alpha-beta hydrolase superfamily lysophospholipase
MNGTFDLRTLYPRLLHFGVAYGDLERVAKSAGNGSSFAGTMEDFGQRWEQAADDAWSKRKLATAKTYWRQAAVYYHYAQLRIPDSPHRDQLRTDSRRCYRKLSALLAPPPVRMEVPFGSVHLPGYFRQAAPGAPCVLVLGGLDSAKEVELDRFAEVFLERGCSVCFFDGPGQGELLDRARMTPQFEAAVSAVMDHLTGMPSPAIPHFGCFGVSFGGYLACRAAATDARIAACISLGGFFDSAVLPKLPPLGAAALRRAYGLTADADLGGVAVGMTLRPLQGKMNSPLLVIHGNDDHLVGMDQITELRQWPSQPAEVWVYQGAEHVCTNYFSECLPRMGDWMAGHLLETTNDAPTILEYDCQEIH